MKKIICLLMCTIFIFTIGFGTTVSAADASGNAFSYVLESDEKGYGVSISKLVSPDVRFPSTYKGLPVQTIRYGSKGASAVKSIYIPDSITKIEDYAFENFKVLEKVSGAKNVEKIGFAAFRNCKKLANVTLGSKVSSIGRYAFEGAPVKSKYNHPNFVIVDDYIISGRAFENETKLVIPEGIIGIADYAFEGAFQMSDMVQGTKTVVLPESLRYIGAYAFFETWGMNEVKLPSKLLSIGEYAFSFNSLTKVNIPASVRTIGVGAFDECNNIIVTVNSGSKYFKIADNVLFRKDGKVIYDNYGKKTGSYIVPEGVVKIADKAFYQSDLTSVTIASTVKTIGRSAFENSKKLKTVVIGKSVSSVGDSAFSDCVKLSSLTVKKGCTTIGERMFAGCTSLKSVTLPAGVKSISHLGFYGCTNLSEISLPSTITFIGNNAFSGTYYQNNGKYENGILYCGTNVIGTISKNLTSTVTIKDGTTCIAAYVFSGLIVSGTTNLTITKNKTVKKIVLPETLKYIGAYSFSDFAALTSVTIPASVKSIGESAFNECDKLTAVTIKGGTTEIGKKSFGYVSGVKTVDVVISALNGSNAHSYAVENGYKFKSIGVHLTNPKLTAVKNLSSGINVKWDAVKYAEGYRIYRKAPGETSWTSLGDVKGLAYTDKNVKNGKQYTYTVRAFNGKTFGGYDKAGITHKFMSTPKLTKIQNGAKGIRIDWSKVSGADGYIVYKKTSGGWTIIAQINDVNVLNYYDKDVKAGAACTYTVKAFDGSLASGYNTSGITIKRLLTPELLSATSAKTGVTLKWGKVTGASGYYVYRKTGSGGWQRIATVTGGTKVSYLDKNAKKGVTYTYTVKAVSGKYVSSHNATGLSIKDKY